MEINILAFGHIADITGNPSWKISGVKNTDEVVKKLAEQFPDFKGSQYSIAVNEVLIKNNTELNHDDIVAFLPPFSGG